MCHDLVLAVWGAGCDHFWWLMCHDLVLVVWGAGCDHFWLLMCHDLVLVVRGAGCDNFLRLVCHDLTLVVWETNTYCYGRGLSPKGIYYLPYSSQSKNSVLVLVTLPVHSICRNLSFAED